MNPLLIKNGEIITASSRQKADILCQNGKITQIGENLSPQLEGLKVIDASGKYVFPGFIDPHVHVYLELPTTKSADDFSSGTLAALFGGTTTVIDFCNPKREQDPREALEYTLSLSENQTYTDYSLHISVPKFDQSVRKRLKEFAEEFGFYSWKVFLAYPDTMGISDSELFDILAYSTEIGALTIAHCENAAIVTALQNQLFSEGKTSPKWHYYSRPPEVEALGVHQLLRFAELADAPAYIVHLSCKEALKEAVEAKLRGVQTYIETLINYLLLDMTMAEREEFEGAKYIMSPPLRDKSNQPILWNALRQNLIDTVSTDHAPFRFKDQKTIGRDDFRKIPNGIPSIEERVNLLYTYGVKRGVLSLEQFVALASTNAAKIFGLYPKKGTIAIGSDADLVVYDPEHSETIEQSKQHSKADYNPYQGWKIEGKPKNVILRGEIMIEEGKFVGRKKGQLVKRTPHES